jgi:hypothetical protein
MLLAVKTFIYRFVRQGKGMMKAIKIRAIAGCVAMLFLCGKAISQTIDTLSTFSVTTYVDAYYAAYRDSVGPGNFQKFATVAARSNSISLNTAQISCIYNAENIRATAVFHYGDIAESTWPHPFNNIQEAHIGFKVYSKLWIDAGFFKTHFGTENFLPSDNITSSLAVASYYEPFFESGIRLNFDPTSKLEINLFLLNGYNIFVDNNSKKSFGAGVTYVVNDHYSVGYTNYTGDDTPPGVAGNHLRIAQNAFVNYQRKKWKVQVGGDYYLQQNSDIATESKWAGMFSSLATAKYQFKPKYAVYGRGEVFQDPNGFVSQIITDKSGQQTGYKLFGITAGAEVKPTENSYVRLEGRWMQIGREQEIFYYNGMYYNSRYEIILNAGILFDVLKNVRRRT